MALIKCPECGNDISNTAKKCVHCGYSFPHKNKKKLIIILGIIAAIIVLFIAAFAWKQVSSEKNALFGKFYSGMTQESVHKLLGVPDETTDNGISIGETYNTNVSFCGLEGTFYTLYEKESLTLDHVRWTVPIPEGKEFKDYEKQIDNIYTYFSNRYDISPLFENEDIWNSNVIWVDKNEQQYTFALVTLEKDNSPSSITLFYYP